MNQCTKCGGRGTITTTVMGPCHLAGGWTAHGPDCYVCGGTGREPVIRNVTCTSCGGSGRR